jgi:hypothetical protein
VINLKTAIALGISIPQSVLASGSSAALPGKLGTLTSPT